MRPDVHTLEKGLCNLEKHLESIQAFNVCPVVAINRFTQDADEEIALIREKCREHGVQAAVVEAWGKGGEGAVELAEMVTDTIRDCKKTFKPLYQWDWSIEKKIETIATQVYGAGKVVYRETARKDLEKLQDLGMENLPVCIAKTAKSLSDDPKRYGRPRNFTLTVREIELAAGAGFIVPKTGEITRMPGLPSKPSAENIESTTTGSSLAFLSGLHFSSARFLSSEGKN